MNYIVAVCGICNNGKIIYSRYLVANHSHPSLIQNNVNYPSDKFSFEGIWPSYNPNIPDGIPDNIQKFYIQGLENLFYQRWDAAGAMFRKTLDVATKVIDIELKKLVLFKRINFLVEKGLLTPAMGDWSHEIRLDGNDAVHDEEPETEIDARRAQKFTEAFLNYSFTLPEMVVRSRAGREPSVV